ncbi:metal-sulfur cluster assembly factor [Cytophagaceae bacterium ABcell3]|nr:metal-sulfur cluster assembly factor [Cytophagaceae bacterium ABcell3]
METNNYSEIETRAKEVLKEVYDPELNVNLVDLGLIYRIEYFEQENKLEVDMTLTTPSCPMSEILPNVTEQRLAQEFSDATISLSLIWQPAWNPDFITEEGKKLLRFS